MESLTTVKTDAPAILGVALVTFAYGVAALPFLVGPADSWDMVGHVFHASLQRELLPQPVFWNPYFFSGYEQFVAYPPLLSLLVAWGSLAIGLIAAFKAVVVLSWLALPGALYFFHRGILPPGPAAAGSALTSLLLVVIEQQIGGTFFSTFVVGNVANTLALLLFLIGLGLLLRQRYRAAVPVFALLLLTHMIAGITVSLVLACKLLFDRRVMSLALAYGLASFWLLPALFDSFRNVRPQDDYPLSGVEILAYLGCLGSYAIFRVLGGDGRHDFLALSIGLIFLLTGVLRLLAPGLWQAIPMHHHRLKVYALAAAVPLALLVLEAGWRAARRDRGSPGTGARWISAAVGAAAAALIVPAGWATPFLRHPPFAPPPLEIEADKVLTVESLPTAPHWHNLRHWLAHRGHLVAKGLFVEASPDGPFYFDLEQMLHARHELPLWWGIAWDADAARDERFVEHLPMLLDVFGIQAIVTDQPLSIATAGSPPHREFAVIERPGQPLVDVPDYPLRFTRRRLSERQWLELIRSWFLERRRELIVNGDAEEPSTAGTARLIEQHRHYNVMRIAVDARRPVAVYIRMGYSTKWKAFTADHRRLPVYRASPNNLVVIADQDFELRFEPLNGFNRLGITLSLVSLLAYGGWLLRGPARRG